MVCGSKVKPTSKTDPIGTLQLCLAHNLVKSLIYFVIMALTRLCTSLLFSAKSNCMGTVRFSARTLAGLKHEGIEIKVTDNPQTKPDSNSLVFGQNFADHMLTVEWDHLNGWNTPKIQPFSNFSLSPGTTVFHYAVECFEGMKAYHGVDGKVRLFRPKLNMNRLNKSADAASLPSFDGDEFIECLKDLVRLDKEWIPKTPNASLYIRPTFIGTEPCIGVRKSNSALLYVITSPVGPYFSKGTFVPVKLFADPAYIRAWEGGVGDSKMGGNYGPTIKVQTIAEQHGCDQVLWLYGDDLQLTEVGTMNIFVHWINENGEPEIATPPLFGTILPGVTRSSLLDLASKWGTHRVVERKVTMAQVKKALEEERMKELFGAGTACVVCPINKILFNGEDMSIPTMETGAEVSSRLYKELTDIQYGRTEHEWSVIVD